MAIQKSKEEILKSLEQIVDNIEQSIQKYMRSFETDISFSIKDTVPLYTA